MNESNFVETIDRTNLTEKIKFRLNKITEIENYFYQKINRRKSCSKKLSKYVAVFDYIDKILVALIVCKCCWSSCRNSKCRFNFNFFSNNRNRQKITKHNKKQKGKAR